MNQEFPRFQQLGDIIDTYLNDSNQGRVFAIEDFRKELFTIFEEGLQVNWVYEQVPPLVLMVQHVREKSHMPRNDYVVALTNTYVQTLRACLLRNEKSHSSPLSQTNTQCTTPQVTTPDVMVLLDNELEPMVHPAKKLVASSQKIATKKGVSQPTSTIDHPTDSSILTAHNEEEDSKVPVQNQADMQHIQSLYNTHRARLLPTVMWSQVDTQDKVQEIMTAYLEELNYLQSVVDVMKKSTIPQLVGYLQKLRTYQEEIEEVSQWIKKQKPIAFRADEQTPSQRFARKSIQRIRVGIDAMLVSLLPA